MRNTLNKLSCGLPAFKSCLYVYLTLLTVLGSIEIVYNAAVTSRVDDAGVNRTMATMRDMESMKMGFLKLVGKLIEIIYTKKDWKSRQKNASF